MARRLRRHAARPLGKANKMIIDFHTHWGTVWEERHPGDPAQWLAVLDSHGVNKAVLFGHASLIRCDRYRQDNDRLAQLAALHPDRFVPFATVWPQTGKDALAEARRCLVDLGMN